jgi:hypothetical protein
MAAQKATNLRWLAGGRGGRSKRITFFGKMNWKPICSPHRQQIGAKPSRRLLPDQEPRALLQIKQCATGPNDEQD